MPKHYRYKPFICYSWFIELYNYNFKKIYKFYEFTASRRWKQFILQNNPASWNYEQFDINIENE